MRINVIIEKDENGYYAFCPEFEGCQTQGETFEETLKNIREAAELYLETLSEEELEKLKNIELITTSLEVKIA